MTARVLSPIINLCPSRPYRRPTLVPMILAPRHQYVDVAFINPTPTSRAAFMPQI